MNIRRINIEYKDGHIYEVEDDRGKFVSYNNHFMAMKEKDAEIDHIRNIAWVDRCLELESKNRNYFKAIKWLISWLEDRKCPVKRKRNCYKKMGGSCEEHWMDSALDPKNNSI